jgi:hypothetical protein
MNKTNPSNNRGDKNVINGAKKTIICAINKIDKQKRLINNIN